MTRNARVAALASDSIQSRSAIRRVFLVSGFRRHRRAGVTSTLLAFAVACGGESPHDTSRASSSHNVAISATTLQATAGSTSEIDLAWLQSSTQVSGWQVYRSTSA